MYHVPLPQHPPTQVVSTQPSPGDQVQQCDRADPCQGTPLRTPLTMTYEETKPRSNPPEPFLLYSTLTPSERVCPPLAVLASTCSVWLTYGPLLGCSDSLSRTCECNKRCFPVPFLWPHLTDQSNITQRRLFFLV